MTQLSRVRTNLSRAVGVGALMSLGLSACSDDGLVGPPPLGNADASAARASQEAPRGLADRGPLERVQFIHYRRGFARPPWAGGGAGTSSCYAFIANGAGWTSPEPWEVYNGSDDGVTQGELSSRVDWSLQDWEDAAGASIVGSGQSGTTDVDLNAMDNVNVVKFGDVTYAGAIAVTNVWGYFRGPQSTREIVEWDMILDDVDFGWSVTGEAGKMDVWNIVAHEVGHALGMGHPEQSCTEETMYAYASGGETKKRTLNAGDEAGIAGLY